MEVISHSNQKQLLFDFRLCQPAGELSKIVQGVWFASVEACQPESVVKRLYSDAGSGVVFNLGSDIVIGDKLLASGVIMLPVSKCAQTIKLPPGARLAGIRFHPAIGYGVFGKLCSIPVLLSPDMDQYSNLYKVFIKLTQQVNDEDHIAILEEWARQYINHSSVMPNPIEKAIDCIIQKERLDQLGVQTGLSQRQIERLFMTWLGMTPKYFQRVLRVKSAIRYLREDKNADLAGVAIEFGFSDQAHMTREFRSIAHTTPRKV